MASPTQNRSHTPNASGHPEIVDPRWLIRALLVTLVAAIGLAYLSVCLLVWQGGWQRMIFPSARIDRTPTDLAIPFEAIHFDAAATGRPRLTGWWIPAATGAAPTVLFVHDVHGSLSNTVLTLGLLHQSGVNVFAFDPRGFGASEGPHPTETRMSEDSFAALDYLLQTRHIAAASIVPYGQGVGSSLAARLFNGRPDLPALIIENPDPDAFEQVVDEDRSRLLPMRLLVRDHFDIRAELAAVNRPRLLFVDTAFGYDSRRSAANQSFFRALPDPKMIVTLHSIHGEEAYIQTVRRFLDERVETPPAVLTK